MKQQNGKRLRKPGWGFTLIELMVVMSIIALLISIAVPRYFQSIDNAKEATLKHSLSVMREAIDKFYGDNQRYPASIEELVARKYLRAVPPDPITDTAQSWIIITPDAETAGGVYDVKSGAPGLAKDGTPYAEW
ncbi:MAG: prepilin-type N-terminal cleavage/methylation domain-containing protein [Methylophilaceae bacterium]|nr:prepilin-type N-terminal cleavage/methylation domain-containing protein [Methylophilaceae bacterium]